mgnify:CR=1 FL=1
MTMTYFIGEIFFPIANSPPIQVRDIIVFASFRHNHPLPPPPSPPVLAPEKGPSSRLRFAMGMRR